MAGSDLLVWLDMEMTGLDPAKERIIAWLEERGSGEGTVTVTNVGESDGDFTLTASNIVDAPAEPPLSSQLTLVISDGTTEVYNGPIANITTEDLGNWAADETHTYTFEVTFASSAGNAYQGGQTTLDFTWTAGQNS